MGRPGTEGADGIPEGICGIVGALGMEGADGADADDDCDAEAVVGMEGADGITEDACGSEGALGMDGMDGMPCADAVPANTNVTAPRANRAGSTFAIIAHTPGRGSILLQAARFGQGSNGPAREPPCRNPGPCLGPPIR